MFASTKRLAGVVFLVWLFLLAFAPGATAEPGRVRLPGHQPAGVAGLTPKGRLPATNKLYLAIGLPLRNRAALDELLRQLYDPQSTDFHRFLTTPEFTARFGPTEQEYQAVIEFAGANGLTVAGTHPNRVVLEVEGSVSNVEQAFQVGLRTYRHPREARDFFAPDREPSAPTNLSVATVEGLSDYGLPKSLLHRIDPRKTRPLGGSGPSGYYAGNDFRNAYAAGTALNGAGQSVGLLEFSAYYQVDITNYENTIGLANYVPLKNVVIGHPTPSTANNAEVALDIEVAIAMAPGLSQVIVYETKSNPSSILNRMVSDNLAKQLSSSWTWSGGPSATIDSIFLQMASQGQSFFQASGDSDAYTGTQTLDNGSQTTAPVDSTNLTCVGGTTLAMNGSGVSWSSETVWNWNNSGQPNVGSGGGISTYYTIPYWQANVSMAANSGSTAWRNVPDVALTADSVYVAYNNGSSGGFGGTSCAAPLWAGFCALVNQQSVAASGTTVGFLNPALYAIAGGSNYANCFHDITTGNNIGTNTPGLFDAVTNYDLGTGLGTPNGTDLINALAPVALPYFITQPSSQTVTNGTRLTFSATVGGPAPLNYQWLLNGTNLSTGGNISGTTSNVLSITAATTNNSGGYQIIAANNSGSVTSSAAVLTVGFAPAFGTQPTNLTVLSGSNAVFSATVSGSTPLAYQWRKNGTNLVNGPGISGATTSSLTLTAVTTNSSGNYSLAATNSFGVATSSVAALTVALPPTITGWLANQTIECGSNITFAATASGTPPLSFQWSFDGAPVPGATNTSLSLTNVHRPDHPVTLVVANPYASAASNAVLSVHDTLAPVITLNGSNAIHIELGAAFSDPGATASDTCAGLVSVVASGAVNPDAVGTNTVVYTANDGNGNTNTAMRTVIVRDTTPPTILWSFTNLVLVAETNCSARMPDVTGTNFILAADLSGPLTIAQIPANDAPLLLGTNLVVITVNDASSNAAYSTNTVIVRDETAPVITLNGSNPLFAELGAVFTDPGATANDTCAGSVPVVASGAINPDAVGTNTVVYTANDGNGNTNTAMRTVIVRDTTPPAILWSFTNLALVADTNCSARMPDVTGTNFILAADLSGPLTIAQIPANGTVLLIGTNLAVITVADVYGNAASSTNTILVQDQTPPVILSQPQSRTNLVGTTANFSASATACTPLAYQWFFNSDVLANQTNSTLMIVSVGPANAGDYSALVTASGGSTASAVATLTVNLLASTVVLTSSGNPSGYKDSVNFTASVTPTNAAGTVQFFTNGTLFDTGTLMAGQSTSTNLAALPRGTNLITALYSGDANDLPATNALAQVITNHPPIAAAAFYNRVAGFPLNIAVADLATNWTDVDGDTISLVDVGVSTNGVTLTNNAGTLVYFDSNDVADQFVCAISDGWSGTNFQTVNITLAPPVSSTPIITSVAGNPDGSFTLNLAGATGYTYILETTTNLNSPESWLPVATNTLGTNGVWQFNDAQATNFSQRFYRAKLVP
jgi:hypothetical protein